MKKKLLKILSFCTSVFKIMIMCYTVPEIWCVTNVVVTFDFGQFFPFYPPNSPKNQNFKKPKKMTGDIIMLHMCTTNYDWMM